MPSEYAYLWTWFTELYHPEGMTYTEIANWAKLTRKKPTPSEVQTLKAIDNAFRKVINDG